MQYESNLISRELPIGTTLYNGLYTIEKVLGSGGFGITYKAKQSGLDKTVCIKEFFIEGKCVRYTQAKTIFLQGVTQEMFEKYRQKFVEEAKLLSNLNHKNIVRVNHVFDENNTSYMVMDYIEGTTLQTIVEKKGSLEYSLAVNYLGQIAEAVQYIHARNILHRDIKPDNIMITPDYLAILIDFGSAREFVEDKTQQHTAMLTRCYAPPEQYNTVSRKGSYSDIYALGAVFYFAMTGREPMEATTRHIEVMPEAITINPEITIDSNRTIHKAMAMKPELRHQTVQEFLDDLYGINPSEPFVDEVELVKQKAKKKQKVFIIVAIIVAIIVSIVVGNIMYNKAESKAQKRREEAREKRFIEMREKAYESYNKARMGSANDWCHYALEIHPDNEEMLMLKDSINAKIIKGWLKDAYIAYETAKDYKDNKDFHKYYDYALDFCDSALKIDYENIEALKLKNEINIIINNIKK